MTSSAWIFAQALRRLLVDVRDIVELDSSEDEFSRIVQNSLGKQGFLSVGE